MVHNGGVDSRDLDLDQFLAAFYRVFPDIFPWMLLLLYLYGSTCIYRLALKAELPYPAGAYIPVVQQFILADAAGVSLAWGVLLWVPVVNLVALVVIGVGLAQQRGRPGSLGFLMLIPGVNMLFLGWLAYTDAPLERIDTLQWAEEGGVMAPWHGSVTADELPPDRKLCRQCQTVFKIMHVPWSDAGVCSRRCLARVGEVTAS